MKKRIAAMVLAGAMALSLAPAYGVTEVKAEAGDMKIAMVTDSGDITDQSFNQTTYEACKAWSEENGSEFNYYKPESDSDEARNASVDQAVADGANVIVLPGYMFAATIVEQSEMYPDVKFIAPDVSAGDICEKGVGEGYTYNPDDYEVTDYYNADNVYCCTYQEEISGYMAGYAAVKLGYKHLGFLGGMSVPAVTRFGYGYVQGVDEAAKELGITSDVELEYVCGGQFYGDADITAYMDTWYGSKGVEVVFACGGGIYTSAAEAAAKVDGKVIGVDSDQSPLAPETILTSALKRVDNACYDATKKAILGTLEGGVATYDLAAGGVDIAPTTDNLSKDVLEKIEDAKKDIIAGDLVVPKNQEEFEEKYGDVYELD